MQITSAMKLVSASKLKKAQDNITEFRKYSDKLSSIIENLNDSNSDFTSKYSHNRKVKKALFLIVSSNKGLCGAFNTNIIKKVKEIKSKEFKNVSVDAICIGKKSFDVLSKGIGGLENVTKKEKVIDKYNYSEIVEIGNYAIKKFLNEEYDVVKVFYNKFKNAGVQIPSIEQVLPIKTKKTNKSKNTYIDYIVEPSAKYIIEKMTPLVIFSQINSSVLDSIASEHGARMTAMHKATDNANELKKDLTLKYNKSRQAAITTEIIEIVSGSNAL